MAVTSQLCERIAGTDYKNLGEPAIEAARRLVLDGIAIAIAGTEEEAIHILAAHHREQGGAGHATAIGNGFRLNTVSASALNGAAMHVLSGGAFLLRRPNTGDQHVSSKQPPRRSRSRGHEPSEDRSLPL